MGLVTLFLFCVIGRYTVVGKVYHIARKILSAGTFLVTLHFILQYWLHKLSPECEEVYRTLLNLSFGIPLSFLFNISNYYILCKGKQSWSAWLTAPVIFVFAMLILGVCTLTNQLKLATVLMSVLYAFTLFYYGVLQIKKYISLHKKIKQKEVQVLLPYLMWTRWSAFFMIFVAFGFPIMTFNTDLLMRSLYGLISIAAAFFYVLSFMGYGINGSLSEKCTLQHGLQADQSNKKVSSVEDEHKLARLRKAVEEFVENGSYLRNGITQREAAIEMGISAYRLKTWLNTTEFETFNRWILYLRLLKAKEILLKDPDTNGDELAEQCGFCDRQYLQRSFRKWTGMTPSQWVKQEIKSSNSPNQKTDDSSSDDN